jgi:hypothetical protein
LVVSKNDGITDGADENDGKIVPDGLDVTDGTDVGPFEGRLVGSGLPSGDIVIGGRTGGGDRSGDSDGLLVGTSVTFLMGKTDGNIVSKRIGVFVGTLVTTGAAIGAIDGGGVVTVGTGAVGAIISARQVV